MVGESLLIDLLDMCTYALVHDELEGVLLLHPVVVAHRLYQLLGLLVHHEVVCSGHRLWSWCEPVISTQQRALPLLDRDLVCVIVWLIDDLLCSFLIIFFVCLLPPLLHVVLGFFCGGLGSLSTTLPFGFNKSFGVGVGLASGTPFFQILMVDLSELASLLVA